MDILVGLLENVTSQVITTAREHAEVQGAPYPIYSMHGLKPVSDSLLMGWQFIYGRSWDRVEIWEVSAWAEYVSKAMLTAE